MQDEIGYKNNKRWGSPPCFCWAGVEGADWGGGAGTLKLFKGCPCILLLPLPPSTPPPTLDGWLLLL